MTDLLLTISNETEVSYIFSCLDAHSELADEMLALYTGDYELWLAFTEKWFEIDEDEDYTVCISEIDSFTLKEIVEAWKAA